MIWKHEFDSLSRILYGYVKKSDYKVPDLELSILKGSSEVNKLEVGNLYCVSKWIGKAKFTYAIILCKLWNIKYNIMPCT